MGRSTDPTSLERGQRAESIAVDHLVAQGYVILERNYRARVGEIDVIAEDGDVLCFVEVRSRRNRDHGDPLETVDPKKQRKLVRAARHYLMGRPGLLPPARFDVVGIVHEPRLEVTLIQNAFEDHSGW